MSEWRRSEEDRLRQLQLDKLERAESTRSFLRMIAFLIVIGMVLYLIVGGR